MELLLARGVVPSAGAVENLGGAVTLMKRVADKLDLMSWALFRDEVLPTLPVEIHAHIDEDEYLAMKVRLLETLERCLKKNRWRAGLEKAKATGDWDAPRREFGDLARPQRRPRSLGVLAAAIVAHNIRDGWSSGPMKADLRFDDLAARPQKYVLWRRSQLTGIIGFRFMTSLKWIRTRVIECTI